MKLPRKGDPRRPLVLAYREMRTLAGLILLYGICSAYQSVRTGIPFIIAITQLLKLIPGLACLALAIYLKRRKYWAVVAGLVVASLLALYAMFMIAAFASVPHFAHDLLINGSAYVIWLLILIPGLILLWVGQLIFNLARSFAAIKFLPLDQSPELSQGHGFEPIMVQPMAIARIEQDGTEETEKKIG